MSCIQLRGKTKKRPITICIPNNFVARSSKIKNKTRNQAPQPHSEKIRNRNCKIRKQSKF